MAKKQKKDLDPKGRAKKVRGGDDRENLRNSQNNILGRDVPNLTKTGTRGIVTVKPGTGVRVKP